MEEIPVIVYDASSPQPLPNQTSRWFGTVVKAALFLGIVAMGVSAVIFLQDPILIWERLVVEYTGAAIIAGLWLMSSTWSKLEFLWNPLRPKVTTATAFACFTFYLTLFSLPVETRLDSYAFKLATIPGMLVIFTWITVWHLLDLRLARLM